MAIKHNGATDVPQTRAAWIDARLRMAILSGELATGAKLRSERLAAEWGVSVTPVREAFHRLAGEGLVEITPQRGARVASLDYEKTAEYYELRLLLEPRALRSSLDEAMADGGGAFRADLRRAIADLDAADSPQAALVAHRAFHFTLLSRCRNQELLRLCTFLQDQTQRFMVNTYREHAHVAPATEHHAIAESALCGDVAQAVRLLKAHLRHTARTASSAPRHADHVLPAAEA